MPRSKEVMISGKKILVEERKIKELKSIMQIKVDLPLGKIVNGETSGFIDNFIANIGGKISEVFPELKEVDLDECYPSELEVFGEAWIDVNFTGIKRLAGPLLSFVRKALQMQESGVENPLASLITGGN